MILDARGDPWSINLQRPINWKHPLNRGLVAWWLCLPHSGWRGGKTWVDLCGKNHGTLTNMDPATDWVGARGRPGGVGALDFDGSNDFVSVANQFSGLAAFTIAGWAFNRSNDPFTVMSQWAAGAAQILIRSSSGTVQFFTFTSAQVGGSVGLTVNSNQWDRYAFVYDGVQMRAYRNGVKAPTTYVQSGAIATFSNDVRIGGGGGGGSEDFQNGLLDDVKLLARGWSDAEARLDFDLSRRGYPVLLNRRQRTFYSVPSTEFIYRYPFTSLGVFQSPVIQGVEYV